MKTTYEVRFVCHQYNSGKADNGYYPFSEEFPTLEEAQKFADKIKALSRKNSEGNRSDRSADFATQYVWGGFVECLDGIYRVQEERIPY